MRKQAASKYTDTSAQISPCERYRYTLTRAWRAGVDMAEMVAFVGLNPSTADASKDDPTVRRWVDFARGWGFPGMVVLNAYAYRATDPVAMLDAMDPVGIHNDYFLEMAARTAKVLVCCWGSNITVRRQADVRRLFLNERPQIYHLGLNKDGAPKHPLYLRRTTPLQVWQ